MAREKLTEVERFWKNVERGDDDDCWLWHGSMSNGYGTVHVGGTNRVAHAVLYEWYVGPIPYGKELDHLCRNRNCVNPKHLEPVTRSQNVRRALEANGKGKPEQALPLRVVPAIPQRRIPARCKRGHALTDDNISWQEVHQGARDFVRWRCKECNRAKTQRYRDAVVQEERALPVPPQSCVHGHALEGENLRLAKTGWVCVECQRAAGRRAYHKKVREPKLLPPKPDFCVNGHAMQGGNVAKNVTGWVCVTCRRAAGLRAYYKKKAMED